MNNLRKLVSKHRLFSSVVVAPTAISLVYFGLLASDVYISESSFVIYSQQTQQSVGLNAFLQSAGLSESSSGAYIVRDYILSRDALTALQSELNVRNIYDNKNVDSINRFGGLVWFDKSTEGLYKYYQTMVGEDIDTASNITTLSTRAYTAEDAEKINSKLLGLSQQLVNRLNATANSDSVEFFNRSVNEAKDKVRLAALGLSNYRNKSGIFNPEPQANVQIQMIEQLQDRAITLQLQLKQLQLVSPLNPQIPAIRSSIDEIKSQISEKTDQIAGGRGSLASESVEYERLVLDKEFAEKELASAYSSLEQARVQAQKQQLFLEPISRPSVPDKALAPKRVRGILATLIIGLLVYGVFSVVLAGIREHNDH